MRIFLLMALMPIFPLYASECACQKEVAEIEKELETTYSGVVDVLSDYGTQIHSIEGQIKQQESSLLSVIQSDLSNLKHDFLDEVSSTLKEDLQQQIQSQIDRHTGVLKEDIKASLESQFVKQNWDLEKKIQSGMDLIAKQMEKTAIENAAKVVDTQVGERLSKAEQSLEKLAPQLNKLYSVEKISAEIDQMNNKLNSNASSLSQLVTQLQQTQAKQEKRDDQFSKAIDEMNKKPQSIDLTALEKLKTTLAADFKKQLEETSKALLKNIGYVMEQVNILEKKIRK